MATILERFKETSVGQFSHSSDATKASQSSSPVVDYPLIKDEVSQKLSCPYANGERQDGGQSNLNNDGTGKEMESGRCLSPEFLLGPQEKIDQDENSKEGPAEVAESVTCVFCNEVLPNPTALKDHTLAKHYATGKKWYDCSVCEKRFTHRSSRDIHLRVHTGQRPYECEYCKKRFRVSSHLRDHVRTHTGERPFKCGVCGRGFKQSSDMKKHRKTHFKEVPSTNTEASYTIVMPEHKATSADNPSDIRSPTERQNLKLVIKRERKTTEIKSPMDAKTASSDSSLPSGESIYSAKTVADKNTLPENKPSGSSTQKLEASEKPLSACDLDPNANWVASSYYSHENGISTIKHTQSPAKSSPGKVAIKRKLDKRPKGQEKNCHKANSYPSMASGLGQMYTSSNGVYYEPRGSALMELASKQLQSVVQNHSSDSPAESLQKGPPKIDTKQAYLYQTTAQMSSETEPPSGSGERVWEPPNKVIKTEKLSPNSIEQSMNHHEFSTVIHEQPTGISLPLPTSVNETLAYSHVQAIYNHEQIPYDHKQPTGNEKRASGTGDQISYRPDWLAESSRNHVNGYTYNGEDSTNTSEELTHNDVNPSPAIASVDSITKQEPGNNHTEEVVLGKVSTEIREDKVEAMDGGSEVPPGKQISEANVIARKPMIVKLRRDKTGAIKTIRKPIKLKDNEEDVQCSVCGNSFKNTDEFTVHKCSKNGKTFKCTICNKTFARQTLLRQHMVLHQGTKRFRFKCNYCGRAFRHRSHLRDHERIHTGERPFKCSFCPKAFKQSSDHRKHENLHTGTTRYRCEKCSLDFKRCDALKRHATMHTKGEVTLLKCDKCRSLFATADGHMSHACLNKPYRYRCQICPERFTDADDLRRHCYELHGEQSTSSCLKCEFCKMEFKSLEKLDEHLSTHRLKKTHRCRTCDQRFSLLNQLVEHVKIHSTQSKTSTTTYEQSEENIADDNDPAAKEFSQEVPPNVKMTPVPDRPTGRQIYDFIPSKYQPPIHASPLYAEMAIGSWARNYYLPVLPKEHRVSREESEPEPISPQNQPISPRLTAVSSRQNSISPRNNPESSRNIADVSENDSILTRSNTEPYRRRTEAPENRPVFSQDAAEAGRGSTESPDKRLPSSQDTVEAYEVNTKLPGEQITRPRRSTETHRASTEASDLTSVPSQNGSIESRPSTIVSAGNEYSQTSPNGLTDPFNTTSFAAYHAIAMHRSSHRTTHNRRKDQKSGRHQSSSDRRQPPSNQYENAIAEHDATSSRHEKATRSQKPSAFATNDHSGLVDNSDVQSSSNPVKAPKNIDENWRFLEVDAGLPSEVLQRSSDRTNFEQLRRNSDEVRRSSERIRSNIENSQTAPLTVQIDLNRNREELAMSENEITDGRKTKEKNRGVYAESHLVQSQTAVKRKYTCLNCRSEFYSESSLVDHVCEIYSEVMYSCLVCKEDFDGQGVLEKHMRGHWEQVVYYTCTLCGERLRSEESLKKHNLKHIENSREFVGDEDGYHRTANGRTQDDPPEHFVSPAGSAKSVTSPVICSVSGNIVTKATTLERGRTERGSTNKNTEAKRSTTNQNATSDDVTTRSSHGAYMPYYEARKQASSYLNVLRDGPTMVVSAMHAAMETSGRYHVPNELLYQPTVTHPGYTAERY